MYNSVVIHDVSLESCAGCGAMCGPGRATRVETTSTIGGNRLGSLGIFANIGVREEAAAQTVCMSGPALGERSKGWRP